MKFCKKQYSIFHYKAVDVFSFTIVERDLASLCSGGRARCWRALPGLCFNEIARRGAVAVAGKRRAARAFSGCVFSGELLPSKMVERALTHVCMCSSASACADYSTLLNAASKQSAQLAGRARHCLALTGGFRK